MYTTPSLETVSLAPLLYSLPGNVRACPGRWSCPTSRLSRTRKIALVDESGEFGYINEAVQQLLGYDPKSLVGEDAFEYIHPDERAAARACFSERIN